MILTSGRRLILLHLLSSDLFLSPYFGWSWSSFASSLIFRSVSLSLFHWPLGHHAVYKGFLVWLEYCLTLVVSSRPKRVSARSVRLNKQTNNQTDRQTTKQVLRWFFFTLATVLGVQKLKKNNNNFLKIKKTISRTSERFCKILARNYAPGAAAPGTAAPEAAALGAWIIWGNILSSICSRSIIWMYTAPGAYLDTLLEHCAF